MSDTPITEAEESYNALVELLRKRFPKNADGSLPDFKIENVLLENNQLRAEVERLKVELGKNNSAACAWDRQVAISERDQLGDEVERLKGDVISLTAQLEHAIGMAKDRDQCRAVAEQFADSFEPHSATCHCSRCAALAAYEKLKGESK